MNASQDHMRALAQLSMTRLASAWHAPWSLSFDTGARTPLSVFIGLLAALIVMIGLVCDADVAQAVLSLPAWLIDLNVTISKLGDSGYLFALALLWMSFGFYFASCATSRRVYMMWVVQMQRGCYLFLVNATSGIFSIVAKNIIGRARPSDLGPFHFEPFTFMAKFASMPSGHSITAFASAYVLATLFPSWRHVFYGLAVLVGVSRIIIHAHYVSDVLTGACVGLFWAYAVGCVMAHSRLGFTSAQNHFNQRGQYLMAHLRASSIFGVYI